jgi:hypothetical protein
MCYAIVWVMRGMGYKGSDCTLICTWVGYYPYPFGYGCQGKGMVSYFPTLGIPLEYLKHMGSNKCVIGH